MKELFLRSKQLKLFAHSVDKPKIVIPIGAKTVTKTVKRNVVGKKYDEIYVYHGYHTPSRYKIPCINLKWFRWHIFRCRFLHNLRWKCVLLFPGLIVEFTVLCSFFENSNIVPFFHSDNKSQEHDDECQKWPFSPPNSLVFNTAMNISINSNRITTTIINQNGRNWWCENRQSKRKI